MFESLRSQAYAYPALEVVHIVGIALLLGNLIALELRMWCFASALPVQSLARLSLGLAGTGFSLAALSGSLMFASQPEELLANRAFTLKMLLLALAACNAAWFHGRNSMDKLDTLAKVQMLLSTLIWLAVIACGRWIAYL